MQFISAEGQAQEFISKTSNSASGAVDGSGSIFHVRACAWVYALADVKARALMAFLYEGICFFSFKRKKIIPFWLCFLVPVKCYRDERCEIFTDRNRLHRHMQARSYFSVSQLAGGCAEAVLYTEGVLVSENLLAILGCAKGK